MSTGTLSRAEEYIRGAVTLSSPPLIFGRLMDVLDDPRCGSAEVARILGDDHSLTARILVVVNSAFYSLPWRVDSISSAVRVVGTRQIRDLALATSVLTLFGEIPGNVLDVDSFRRHSLACGVVARILAGHLGESNVERFFVAGLLHDIGRFVLVSGGGDAMAVAIEDARESRRDLGVCEREHLGCTHAEVGRALLERWSFPSALRECVRFHHQPQRATLFPVETAVIHVSDVITHAVGWGRSGQPHVPSFDAKAWKILSIDASIIPALVEEAATQLDAAEVLLFGDEEAA